MTTYYVRKTGNDSSAGTSAGTAWLTLAKALGASGIASGDTVYVGAGIYRETVTVAMTSASAETKVVGDYDGSQTGDAGEVRLTAYTTDDSTAPANTTALSLAGRRYLTFENILFHGGGSTAHLIDGYTSGACRNLTLRDCTFIHQGILGSGDCLYWQGTANVDNALLVERCRFLQLGTHAALCLNLPMSGSSAYDAGLNVVNCLFLCNGQSFGYGAAGVYIDNVGGFSVANPGGVRILNCTYLGRDALARVATSAFDSGGTYPCQVKNCLVMSANYGLDANSSGQIVEDYNRIVAPTPRNSVSSGSNSISNTSHAVLLHLGQEMASGLLPRHCLGPTIDSPLLGFGNDSSPTPPTTDLLNRPRPSGPGVTWGTALSAAGCLERHDFGIKETTTVDSGSTASLKMTGPGDAEFRMPVDATSTTITIKVRRDGTYAGTNPQLVLLACPELGISTQTVTDAGSANAWNTLSLSAFTPSGRGLVTLRLVSNSTAGGGVTYWDTLSVT